MFNRSRSQRNSKLWPAECPWPEPVGEGFGSYWEAEDAESLPIDEETEDLLNAAGFALSRSMIVDIVIKYCIVNDMRSVDEVNNILESWGLETI